ncbi:MAG: hypothetical protein QM800_07250 [Paludibacter sp.]
MKYDICELKSGEIRKIKMPLRKTGVLPKGIILSCRFSTDM